MIPKILIAGTNSGCGKTTVSMGIMAALKKKGYRVQPFKVGADFIDPKFHEYITGKISRNLDGWMLDSETIKYLYCNNLNESDIAVIEGAMGLFDGFLETNETGSTSHVSKIIDAPVILVANGDGMALSIIALLKNYMEFGRDADIKGVILNNIDDKKYYKYMKEIIEKNLGLKVVGHVRRMETINITSRERGLVGPKSIIELQKRIDLLADSILETLDFDFIINVAKDAKETVYNGDIKMSLKTVFEKGRKPVIAIPRDRAFNFYYKDNLDLLEDYGAELVFFDTLRSKIVPNEADAIYIGGGYTELNAEELSKNKSLLINIKSKVEDNIPIYAESAGFTYLTKGLRDKKNKFYNFVNIFNMESQMTNKLQRYGYVEIEAKDDNIISKKGDLFRGHEHLYFKIKENEDYHTSLKIIKRRVCEDWVWDCGFRYKNVMASFQHLHFWSNRNIAKNLVLSAKKYADSKERQ